jgi:ABC-type dipeptide/oligopeptide/nickel transport system permease component
VAAVLAKDITLLLGVVLVFGTLVVVMNLLVDLLYAWIDPRIQVER